jgi:MFS family permease
MRRILARPDLRLYLGAQALSLFGDSAMWLALAIWVKSLTGSSSAAGLVIFVFLAPALLAPLAGLLVDRVHKRRLLIAVNLGTAAVICALLLVRSADQLWLIYAVTLVYGVSYVILGSAQSAFLRILVPEDGDLADANGALQTMRQLMRLLAPVAGAGLFAAFGPGVVVLVDVATFLVAAAALTRLRTVEPAPEPKPAAHDWWTEITAGIVHVRRTVVLRQIVVAVAVALLVAGFFETLGFAIVEHGLHRSPAFVGVLDVAMGFGSVLGGVLAGGVVRRVGTGLAVAAGLAVFAAGSAATVLSSVAPVLAGMFVLGIGIPWLIVGLWTTMQTLTPMHLQGRTFSAIDVLVSVPQTVSIGIGAGLVAVVDYRVLVGIVVAVVLIAAAYLATRPEQRRQDRPQPEPEPASVPA